MSETQALSRDLIHEIMARVFDEPGFIKLTQSLRRGGKLFRVSMRPVLLRGEAGFQGEMIDDGQTLVKNLTPMQAREGLDDILTQQGARDFHLITETGDLHLRVTKKGRVLVSRSGALPARKAPPLTHDRVKKQPLTSFDSAALLRVIGLADANGTLKPSMRGKYDQVNEFLRELDATLPELPAGSDFSFVDCGCGKAYLTLAATLYLSQARSLSVTAVGIDKREDVIETAQKMAAALDITGAASFQSCLIADAQVEFTPDLVVSFHACDTATDDALAFAVRKGARAILCAPCCQHELHNALSNGGGPMRALLRHGILRERLADLLTDTYRAQILRILGYRTRVVEFVAPDATARNILIRAELGVKPGRIEAVREYLDLRDFWSVKPYLEEALSDLLARFFE